MKKLVICWFLLCPLIAIGEESLQNVPVDIGNPITTAAIMHKLEDTKHPATAKSSSPAVPATTQSSLVKWNLKKGNIIAVHFHPNEQITRVMTGSIKVISQGKEVIIKAGEVLIIPPYVPHKFIALEDTAGIDSFALVQEDWLHSASGYLQAIQEPGDKKFG